MNLMLKLKMDNWITWKTDLICNAKLRFRTKYHKKLATECGLVWLKFMGNSDDGLKSAKRGKRDTLSYGVKKLVRKQCLQ